MTTTARILTGSSAAALGLVAALLWAEPVPNGPNPAFNRAGAGQPAASRQATDDLLRRARQALGQNDLDAARQLIAQAEATGVDYGPFYTGDTPQKVRRDLERRLQANSTAGRAGTSLTPSRGAGPADPFAAYPRRADAPARAVTPLPPTDQASPIRPAVPYGPPAADPREPQGDANAAYGLLLESRRALAVGDTRRAAALAQRARAANVAFGPADNPEKVEAAVANYSDLMAQRAERGDTESWRRQHAKLLMDQADAMLRWQQYDEAERLATEAARQRVVFSPYEPRPEQLLDHIANLRRQGRTPMPAQDGVVQAGGQYVTQANGTGDYDRRAANAVYDPANDPTRNILAGSQQQEPPLGVRFPQGPMVPPTVAPGQAGMGMTLFQQGETALRAHDAQAALDLFRQAYAHVNELDPVTARRLQEYLQLLPQTIQPPRQPGGNSPIDAAAARQQVLAKQVAADVAQAMSNARKTIENDPKAALGLLEQTKKKVEAAGLEPPVRDRMLRQIDRELADARKYVQEHKPQIDLGERNQKVRQDLDRQQQNQTEMQNKLAQKVDEFNGLMHEHRYAEAEVVAKQAAELDPDSPLAAQLVLNAKFVRRMAEQRQLRDQKEQAVVDTLKAVEDASVPFSGENPYVFPKNWKEMSGNRAKFVKDMGRRRSEKEVEIHRKLKTPVALQFDNAPLSKVVDYLAKLSEVNIYLDPQGLAEEGVTTDTPVTIDLRHEVKLESALKLILPPMHLTYVVKDEVLKITSEQARNTDLTTITYNVADLVIPIPNFAPNRGLGLESAYAGAMSAANVGLQGAMPFGGSTVSPMAVVATKDGRGASGMLPDNLLAQMPSGGARGGGPAPKNVPVGAGPGGAGGGTQADFDSLIDLITSTIQPTTWDEVGGPGSIAPFETNLSLVVSQTQEVHEEIVDLLEQLRRMQDLQVTIEVRFITLNDNFFERIGVDFDFNINDRTDHPGMVFGRVTDPGTPGNPGVSPTRDVRKEVIRESSLGRDSTATVGLAQPGVFSADLDIPFTQNSYTLAVPQFGGFDATAGAQLGFAILSDIEAFFFISAAQGDRRSNVLQAPKVTLFNGQQAFVSDTSQSPFVISVIPVVGDFAAAQQPVICVLNEGTFLTVQAVVSNDRRFVRLTVVPFFSQIDKVDTFQFVGSETTTEDSSEQGVQDKPNDSSKKAKKTEVQRSGTTVQLPTFSFITVTTTVSVPDGGTVLLGGIKRLSEGRNEFGVPILNKIPYINRLFKNVGIGRETQSLMMMVTPRIIIQEEEEARLGIEAQP